MRRTGRIAVLVPVLIATLVLAAVVVWWSARTPEPDTLASRPRVSSAGSPSAEPSPAVQSTKAAPGSVCAHPADRAFQPSRIKVADLPGSWTVIAPPRDAAGVPGVPPLTNSGKRVFAWDPEQGIRPGDPRGNVLLNAHSWPDGTALGNQLLRALHRGDRLVVRGEKLVLCYQVTKRLEVPAAQGLLSYYATEGPPQLAIVACSGRHLGPARWENRTIWFASPIA